MIGHPWAALARGVEEIPLSAVLLKLTYSLRTPEDEGAVARILAAALHGAALYDPAYGVSIYRHDRSSAVLEQILSDDPLGLNVEVGMSIAARVVRRDDRFARGTRDDDGTGASYTAAGVPLHDGADLVGVLVVYRAPRRPYTDDEDSLLHIIALQGAATIGRLRRVAVVETARNGRIENTGVDQMHADFISTVSHELLTPLTSIIGFTETLQQYWARLTDEQKRQSIGKIGLSGRRLEHLVHEVLTVSQLEACEITMHSGPVALDAVARTAIHGVEARHAALGAREEIVVESVPAGVTALADRARLERVVVSLLENAVLYSPPQSPIVVRCRQEAAHAILDVVDQGDGIAPDDMARLFTRFGKISTTVRAGHSGTGLGLYIARGLVEAMGGMLTVDSTPRRGSTFRVTLPLFETTAPLLLPR